VVEPSVDSHNIEVCRQDNMWVHNRCNMEMVPVLEDLMKQRKFIFVDQFDNWYACFYYS